METDSISNPLPASFTIEKRDSISREEFLKEYVEKSKPVILKKAALQWKAMGEITPSFIKSKYGHLKKTIDGTEYTYAELIDRIQVSTPENPSPYPFNINIEKICPEIISDAMPELVYGKIDRVNHPLLPRRLMQGTEVYELFIGGNGSSFPYLHIDALYLHNQMTQLYGSKEFILFPPDQAKYLYVSPDEPMVSPVDVFHPDYNKFPLFRNAKPVRVTIEQGETLFFPTGWWHSTQIHEPSISFGRVQLNGINWNKYIGDKYKDYKKKSVFLAIPLFIYLKLAGLVMDIQERFSS